MSKLRRAILVAMESYLAGDAAYPYYVASRMTGSYSPATAAWRQKDARSFRGFTLAVGQEMSRMEKDGLLKKVKGSKKTCYNLTKEGAKEGAPLWLASWARVFEGKVKYYTSVMENGR